MQPVSKLDDELDQRIEHALSKSIHRLVAGALVDIMQDMTQFQHVFVNNSANYSTHRNATRLDSVFGRVVRSTVIDLLNGSDETVKTSIEKSLADSAEFRASVYDTMIEPIKNNANIFFLLAMGIFVFNMQAGFALLEIGSVRAKNAANSLWKNLSSCFITALSFWLIGMAVAFGESHHGAAGSTFWAFDGLPKATGQGTDLMFWFFQYVFCTTVGGILTGAIAERAQLISFIIYAFVTGTITYPIAVHWCWNPDGWLRKGGDYEINGEMVNIGYEDFAGSGVVHTCGGISSLIAIIFVGPRIGRFGANGVVNEIAPHSVTLVGAGAMSLFTGFLAFNAGSEMSISAEGDAEKINRAVVGTILAGTGGFFFVAIFERIREGRWLVIPMLCGGLAGNVAACCSCAVTEGWAAFIIGILAGSVFVLFSWGLKKLRIDDAVDAVPVHCGGGFVGVISLAFFKIDHGIFYKWDRQAALILGWQMLGFIMISLWSGLNAYVAFYLMKMFNLIRVDAESELIGLDYAHGHEIPYPAEAYKTPNIHSGGDISSVGDNSFDQLLMEESAKYTDEEINNPGWSHPVYRGVLYDLSWISLVRNRNRPVKFEKTIKLTPAEPVYTSNAGAVNHYARNGVYHNKPHANGFKTSTTDNTFVRTQLAPIVSVDVPDEIFETSSLPAASPYTAHHYEGVLV